MIQITSCKYVAAGPVRTENTPLLGVRHHVVSLDSGFTGCGSHHGLSRKSLKRKFTF